MGHHFATQQWQNLSGRGFSLSYNKDSAEPYLSILSSSKMENTINILHVTDAHINESNRAEIKQRVDALIKYLKVEKQEIDILAFTGDLAFSGQNNEYELFDEVVLCPLKSQLKINQSKILLVPGNHDVDRNAVGLLEFRQTREFSSGREAESAIKGFNESCPRLAKYIDFQSKYSVAGKDGYSYKEHAHGLFTTRKLLIKGMLVGVACFNTAWLCVDDKDQNKLFLTEHQIRTAIEELEGCNLRIALCHHPFEWLHESENEITTVDLKREFQLILTGHLHRPFSVSEATTSFQTLVFTGRALFDGKSGAEVEDGFHLYKVAVSESIVTAQYRKYIRRRNTYDGDNDHAQQGTHSFALSVPIATNAVSALMAHKLSSVSSIIPSEIHKALSSLQGTDTPVFITPKMRSFQFKGGERKIIDKSLSIHDVLTRNTIICGPRDAGKTILLKTLASTEKQSRVAGSRLQAAIYIATTDIPNDIDREMFVSLVEQKSEYSSEDLLHIDLLVCTDVPARNPSEFVKVLMNVCDEYGWTYCAAVGNVIADAFSQDETFGNTLFVEIRPWGPSRIREFANKLFSGTEVDPESAYKFVSECMRTVDLPATPTVISLYMSIFPKAGAGFSSLSFLRLLEKIEQVRLGINEPSSVESLYNRRKILEIMAIKCLAAEDISIKQEELTVIISDFFGPKRLVVDSMVFTHNLVSAGILRAEEDEIGFAHFAFFDYYLALAFKEGLADPLLYTNTLEQSGRVAHSLSLFAGLDRENLTLAEKLMNAVEARFIASGELRLRDLDSHISDLLMPESRKPEEADKVATENLECRIDYEAEDEEYDKQKRSISTNRKKMMEKGRDNSADELTIQITGLHSFYSIFKNLENIDGDLKELYLDRILDFHITTNFTLIDFYFQFSKDEKFRTFAAYLLTWSGHGFMSSSLGNPSLCQTICDVIHSTNSDFKRFLLLLLLSDLRDSRAVAMIEDFIMETDSRAATEILFLHTQNRLIDYEGRDIPVSLIATFKKIFIRRQTKFGGAGNRLNALNEFDKTMRTVKIEHWKSYSSKGLDSKSFAS